MKRITQVIFFYIFFNADLHCSVEPVLEIESSLICFDTKRKCINSKKITVTKDTYQIKKSSKNTYIISSINQMDLQTAEKFSEKYNLNKNQRRKLLQQTSLYLNQRFRSVLSRNFAKFYREKIIKNITYLPIQNAIEVYVNPKYQPLFEQFLSSVRINTDSSSKIKNNDPKSFKEKPKALKQNEKKLNLTLAIIDSGVSNNHENLKHLSELKQYNPEDDSFDLHDSALGHGTGVLSLIAGTHLKHDLPLPDTDFLSCNGLPQGKYNYRLILKCLNWLFLQPSLDIIINPWLMPESGCDMSLKQAYDTLWFAGTLSIFPSGNYGPSQSYSPANYGLYDGSPMISIGSIDTNGKATEKSSYGKSVCDKTIISPTFVEQADKVKVAVPFTQNSYQTAEGTSYAIAIFARKILLILERNPEISNKQLREVLINSAQYKTYQKKVGYGVIDENKALKELEGK